jgi:dihydroorotate dehydrogenase electron transfer subunit
MAAMSDLTAILTEVALLGGQRVGVLALDPALWPEPGQYLPAQRVGASPDVFPAHLFRVSSAPDRLTVGPIPAAWSPGDELALLRPHGHGFELAPAARRMGLCALDVPPARLLPLVSPALAQDAAVTLFCDPHPDLDMLRQLPAAVEAAPLSGLLADPGWPDYLAVDLPRESLPKLRALLGGSKLPFEGQALVRTAMPCRGVGECGVCAVETQHGLKLTCIDGPVFPLEEVLHVAG